MSEASTGCPAAGWFVSDAVGAVCSHLLPHDEDFRNDYNPAVQGVIMLSGVTVLQERMVDGHFFIDKESPYKSLQDLWDGEQTEESLASLQKQS